jgi:hypothetical protein
MPLIEVENGSRLIPISIRELQYSGLYVISADDPKNFISGGFLYESGKYIGTSLWGPTFNVGHGVHKRFDTSFTFYKYV